VLSWHHATLPLHSSFLLPAESLSYQVQRLLSPAEMGEFFKVIGFSKNGQTIAALENARQMPL
jgi:hypothetical protein